MFSARNSHGHRHDNLLPSASPEGWWILAGGNTPGNRPTTLYPGGGLESATTYRPTRPISPVDPILHEPLIRVENGLKPTLLRTSYRPIIRPENKGIKPKSSRHRPKNFIARGACRAVASRRRVAVTQSLAWSPEFAIA